MANHDKYDLLATSIHNVKKNQFIKLQNQENLKKRKKRFQMMCQLSKERRKYFTEKLQADPPPDYNAFHGIDAFLPPKLLQQEDESPEPIRFISADTHTQIEPPKKDAKQQQQKDGEAFFLTEVTTQPLPEEETDNNNNNDDDESLYTSLEEPEKRITYDHLSSYKVPHVYALPTPKHEKRPLSKSSVLFLLTRHDKQLGHLPEIPSTKMNPPKRIPTISRYSTLDTQPLVDQVVRKKAHTHPKKPIRMLANYRQYRTRPTQPMQRLVPQDKQHFSSSMPIHQQKRVVAYHKQQHIDTSSFDELRHVTMDKLIDISKNTLQQPTTQSDALPPRPL